MIKRLCLFSIVCAGLALFSNCSTSIWPSSDDNKKETADGNISLGNEAKNAKDFTTALAYYTRATELDPRLSDGWYLKAEMELRVEGIILPMLVNELQNENTKKLPFFPDTGVDYSVILRTAAYFDSSVNRDSIVGITALDTLYDRLVFLYSPCIKAYNSLLNIFGGQAEKGNFTSDKILLDFTMLSALHTALVSLDQKPSDNRLTPFYGPYNKERKLYKIMGNGLKNIDSIEIDIDSVKQLFTGPTDINAMINDLVDAANISLEAITQLDDEIHASTAEGVDTGMMSGPKEQMNTIILKAKYYYYNDKKDNDYDYYDTNDDSLVQRTIWIDVDGNNKIDWIDPQNNAIHWCLSDTFAAMRDIPGYDYNRGFFALDSIGSEAYYIFKGPNGGEFIAGDWGVDEEQLDDADNDLDGIKDEDSRIATDTIDNDGDFINIDTLAAGAITIRPQGDSIVHGSGRFALIGPYAGKNLSRLVWVDYNGNGRIDYNNTHIDSAYVIQNRAAIMATINAGQPYGEWLAGDWGVDEEYVDGIDNDGDGRIDEDGDIHLIHRDEYWSAIERINYLNAVKDTLQAHPENLLGMPGPVYRP
ncbi:MAG: hypothetical protein A2268_03215 [Candidatus Raymondbacteria bacterium RifOxyA12_full_50_37]|uniref:Uncharacterized protein n=1 Tax=Candidatus Raymondbacteria bacterium RIFOXYD12_FULL_49_13 TaxID=1817890 RepID=A0A1F7F8H1_UNCRA|nr:MAG: hypothetical protein A2268_03215 [Candidatus Raymondbacteria bacterium RifOxyA12_full_50_37]OGJ86749.1 MAG: hypothetical protein A2248_09945 [Candidatus Raymondbacteria bacterium RIFOXYA2_FULL_49_16]OGK01554.1 MAG: hypothetical protein A2350_06485 [Candidatus Raymondbacteria bacterium RifOxyB12_full_50_8]OGK02842.1 MAG: hypothetical protein A2519_06655 [Candidatus Raymondbacteria bacterium RIFOXYD12_FULL_49_13]OGK03573.1 MAG: hypothetical protein A2487_05050 [Candidatus Raymondbacteria 